MSNGEGGGAATERLRLGVNIDHVATLRNARGGAHPDPVRAAQLVAGAGADGLTIHLREDRRHIVDADVEALSAAAILPINLEMAATEEMASIALARRPNAVCLVPERREERTTEGGLDVAGDQARLAAYVAPLRAAGVRISLFIAPDPRQIEASKAVGADIVELHTGPYCHAAPGAAREAALALLQSGARHAAALGLEPHAGHGLAFDSVGPVAAIPEFAELNIGHFLIGEAVFTGLEAAIRRMRAMMDESRGRAGAAS
ncbi:MAG: pyridoxine 5'-phosphate synthase [Pseudomonadota bacterium]